MWQSYSLNLVKALTQVWQNSKVYLVRIVTDFQRETNYLNALHNTSHLKVTLKQVDANLFLTNFH